MEPNPQEKISSQQRAVAVYRFLLWLLPGPITFGLFLGLNRLFRYFRWADNLVLGVTWVLSALAIICAIGWFEAHLHHQLKRTSRDVAFRVLFFLILQICLIPVFLYKLLPAILRIVNLFW